MIETGKKPVIRTLLAIGGLTASGFLASCGNSSENAEKPSQADSTSAPNKGAQMCSTMKDIGSVMLTHEQAADIARGNDHGVPAPLVSILTHNNSIKPVAVAAEISPLDTPGTENYETARLATITIAHAVGVTHNISGMPDPKQTPGQVEVFTGQMTTAPCLPGQQAGPSVGITA